MNAEAKDQILSIISRAIDILEKKEKQDIAQLSELSDDSIKCSCIFQEESAISIAVMIYMIYKLVSRRLSNRLIYTQILTELKNLKKILAEELYIQYENKIRSIFEMLRNIDSEIPLYFQKTLEKAKIKKGSTLFAHGFSAAKVADMLGISQWAILNYIGKTTIIDESVGHISVKKRLTIARRIFGLYKD